ncbi:MFS transporter [Ammonicoccus fulvus]|uniref:Multidrug efflux pump Tap n=1 Tax=Ammonicoccus fulvus TaxID=3138240 RepID=A0ABZ3FW36_9ACTN
MAGLVAAASAAPSAVAALVGGHLVDRIGRRTICVISDVGSALSVAGLAVGDLTVGLNVTWFIVLGILGALFDVPGMTARETMLAQVSETSGVNLDKVAAARGTVFGLTFLAGPAVAGGLLAVLPDIHVVWLTAACSALAAVAILVIPLRPPAASDSASDDSPLAGWRLVRNNRMLLTLMLISVAIMMLVAPLLSVLLPAHFRELARPEFLGFSLSAYALGTMVGSALYGALFGKRRLTAWVVSNVLFTAGFVSIATLAGFWPVAIGMLVIGVGSGFQQPIVMVILTRAVPDAMRGRVFGLNAALGMIAAPLGLGLMAAAVAGTNLGVTAWILAACWTAVSVWAILAPSLRAYLRAMAEEETHADHRPVG